MSGPWFVEVLDRHQRVQQRLRVTQWPVVVGRGYDCDLVLDDPHLAPRHVEFSLDDDGKVIARDLGTVNGLRAPGAHVRRGQPSTPSMLLQPGDVVEAGRTRLRVSASTMPVAPERPLDSRVQVPMWLVALLPISLVALQVLDAWFSGLDDFKPIAAGVNVVFLVLGLAAWAGLWALLTRVVMGMPRFAQHLAWASGMALVGMVVPWLLDTVAFAMNWPVLVSSQRWLGLLWATGWLLGHLRIALGPLSLRTTSVAAGLAVIGLGLMMAESWQSQHSVWPNTFMTTMRPPAWRVAGERGLDDFYQAARKRQAQVDALRKVDGEGDEDQGP